MFILGNDISVIIPVKNEEKRIKTCIKAVLNQSLSPYEVIVVDGHSSDRTVDYAKELGAKILYENHKTRAGACQVGVDHSNGNFVAFTDADCVSHRDWLRNLIKEFDNEIVGVGGIIKNNGNGLWEKSINLAMESFIGSANSVQGRPFPSKRYVRSLSGCNSMYRKEDISKVGGFDLELSTAEDTNLSAKLLKVGNLLYTPDAIIFHNHQRGLKDFAKRMYQYGYGRAKSGLLDIQVILPIFALLLIISLIITPDLFVLSFVLYVLIILFEGARIAIRQKNASYLMSVPITFFVEHLMYTIGYWSGLASVYYRFAMMRINNLMI